MKIPGILKWNMKAKKFIDKDQARFYSSTKRNSFARKKILRKL
jgi:hypothetical protein